jgi:hypothetical protein
MMELHFSEQYDKDFMLIEVPDSIAERINSNGELILKGGEQTILCTNDKSYELKYVETSNTFIVLSNPAMSDGNINEDRKEISLMINHTLECADYTPRKFNIFNILKHECSLNYNRETGESNFNSFERKYTIKELFSMSELCSNDFKKMIEIYGIFEKNGYACVHDESFLFSILDDILVMLHKENANYEKISSEEIFSDKLININPLYSTLSSNFCETEKDSILKNIFDIYNDSDDVDMNSNSKFYKINIDKVKLFCTKNIFHVQKEANFKLEDFISILKNMLIVSLPYPIVDKVTLSNHEYSLTSADDNIFEGYKDFDLRFAKGYCVIYFLKTQRDALIK